MPLKSGRLAVAPRMGRRPRAVCFMSGSTLLRLKPGAADRLTSVIGRMMRLMSQDCAKTLGVEECSHGFAQYPTHGCLVLVDEILGRERWSPQMRRRALRPRRASLR